MKTEPVPVLRATLVQAVPNLLTSCRLLLGIAFPTLPLAWRLPVLLVAVATEFLDGLLARLLRAPSVTGQVLDPIADKVFVVSVLATLVLDRTVAPWQLVLVAARDILVAGGTLWVAARRGLAALKRMPPSWVGKFATAAQLAFLVTAVITGTCSTPLFVLASVLSLAAGIDYLVRYPRRAAQGGQ